MDPHLREAQLDDFRFMQEMLYEAVFWRTDPNRPSLPDALAYPETEKALRDWPERPGDTGVVATIGSTPLGAAWYRLWTAEDDMRGYVDDTTPVLAIAVQQDHRRRGIGTLLLDWLIDRASTQSIARISLAVAKDNQALSLYRRMGFIEHSDTGDSFVMVRSLRPDPTTSPPAAPPLL